MTDDIQNKQSMKEAIDTLNQIVSSNSTPKTIEKINFRFDCKPNQSRIFIIS